MESFETAPAAVIEPCTQRIADKDLSPDQRAMAFYIRARGYNRTGRVELSAQDYDVAIKLAPAHAEFYVHRSNTAYRLGRYRDGYADLVQALVLDPRNAIALRALGMAYMGSGSLDKALDFFGQALAVDPSEPYALLFRSRLYARMHRTADALKDADALVAIPADVINRLGFVNSRSELEDFHVIALTNRAEIYRSIGQQDQASKDLGAAVTQKWSPEALVARGESSLLSPGHEEAALKDFEEAVRLDQNDFRAQYERGVTLMRLNRLDAALQSFDLVVQLQPNFGNSFYIRARIHRGLGQTDAAIEDFEKAMTLDGTVRDQARTAFVRAGYLEASNRTPSTADLHAAVQACMLDPTC